MTSRPPLPYEFLPPVAGFVVRSDDVADGGTLALAQVSGIFGAGGDDRSPHLAWSGAPAGTQSFAVSCFDPDAPTGSGFWHWFVVDIPATVTELATGAGTADGSGLPPGAVQLRNDAGIPGYVGAGPPPGHGPHRYCFAVHAVAVPTLGVDAGATNALTGFHLFGTTLGRGLLTAHYER
ncbi:MAG: YbhB/YbcL family Raf kinase inhibitor-like protein [Actinobacteria bacterium]|nr:YbhB/YbcL family Raf kinase inhibitor-like protein [Actinomycetota bacterium]